MVTVDLLRRPIPNLRSPYLCNWSHEVAHAIADWLSDTADLQELADLNRDEVQFLDKAVATARALLRSFGHTCADTGEPCRQCAARVPMPEDVL